MKQSEWSNELKTNFYLIQEYENAIIARSLEKNSQDQEVDDEFLQKVSGIFEHGKWYVVDIHPMSFSRNENSNLIVKMLMDKLRFYVRSKKLDQLI